MANSGLMDEKAVQQWILRKLGAPLLRVELVQDDLDDAVEEARRWFSAKKGFKKVGTMGIVAGQVEYPLDEGIDTILDVTPTNNEVDVARFIDPMQLVDGLIPASIFGAGLGGAGGYASSGGMLSSYAQTVQYLHQARTILGAEFEWEQRERSLLVFPARTNGSMIIHYKAATFTVEQLNERDHDLVKRYSLAVAREKLGTVRTKFAQTPGAQDAVTVDGPEQLEKAEREKEALTEEISQSGFPMGFLHG
jgi:hypothetical protein